MKKIISILSTIFLSNIIIIIIIIINLIACNTSNKNNKPNTNKNETEKQFTPQQPPTNSNGKLVDDIKNVDQYNGKDKTYIGIVKVLRNNKGNGIIENGKLHPPFSNVYLSSYKNIYRGDGNNEPTTPTINKNTGEIINGNE